jgi:hypothetical protein
MTKAKIHLIVLLTVITVGKLNPFFSASLQGNWIRFFPFQVKWKEFTRNEKRNTNFIIANVLFVVFNMYVYDVTSFKFLTYLPCGSSFFLGHGGRWELAIFVGPKDLWREEKISRVFVVILNMATHHPYMGGQRMF